MKMRMILVTTKTTLQVCKLTLTTEKIIAETQTRIEELLRTLKIVVINGCESQKMQL